MNCTKRIYFGNTAGEDKFGLCYMKLDSKSHFSYDARRNLYNVNWRQTKHRSIETFEFLYFDVYINFFRVFVLKNSLETIANRKLQRRETNTVRVAADSFRIIHEQTKICV